jgi:hypothetical protein
LPARGTVSYARGANINTRVFEGRKTEAKATIVQEKPTATAAGEEWKRESEHWQRSSTA